MFIVHQIFMFISSMLFFYLQKLNKSLKVEPRTSDQVMPSTTPQPPHPTLCSLSLPLCAWGRHRALSARCWSQLATHDGQSTYATVFLPVAEKAQAATTVIMMHGRGEPSKVFLEQILHST